MKYTREENRQIIVGFLIIFAFLCAIGVIYLSLGCNSGAPVEPEEAGDTAAPGLMSRPTFKTVYQNYQCGWTDHAGIVVRDRKKLEWVWEKFYSHSLYPKPVPDVDFDRVMWICVFRGNYPTWGYTTEIRRIEKGSDAHNSYLRVWVLETNPNRFMYVKQEFSQPFHIIEIPRSDLTVRFTYIELPRLR